MAANQSEILIDFPQGIPGFENVKQFSVHREEEMPFAWLKAVHSEGVGFFILQPQLLFPDYLPQVDLGSEEVEILGVSPEDNVDVWAILTVYSKDLSKSTVNLRAPLILNPRTKKGIQLVLNEDRYSSRQPLIAAPQDSGKGKGLTEGAVG